MKKLLLILLLIPALLNAQSKEEKKAQEKAKKEAVKNLKAVLKKYPHWKWNGEINEDKVEEINSITITSDSNISIGISFYTKNKQNMGSAIYILFPRYIVPAWDELPEGEKTLTITCRTNNNGPYTTKIYRDNNPSKFFFKPGVNATTEDGKDINPMKDVFYSTFFAFKCLTSYYGSEKGEVYQILINTDGVKDIQTAALAVLSLPL